MKENQKILSISSAIAEIRENLTPDLLNSQWKHSADGVTGHCYVATEALYWLLGKELGFKPHVLSHSICPELLDEGETHWFLMKDNDIILDVTADQFKGANIPYHKGKPNGMMNHPEGGSQRAQILIKRIIK